MTHYFMKFLLSNIEEKKKQNNKGPSFPQAHSWLPC